MIASVKYTDFIPKDKNILSLDISKTCTGWVKVINGTITHGVFEIKTTSENGVVELQEFKKFLKGITKGIDFDIICVEDIIGSVNFKTAKILYRLNLSVDDLVYENEINTKELVRIDNKKWKKYLKEVSSYNNTIKGYKDDKKVVRDCLHSLGFNEDVKQDIYDAYGVLIGVLYEKYFYNKNEKKASKKTVSFNKLKMKNFNNEKDAFNYANKVNKEVHYYDISNKGILLESYWKKELKDIEGVIIVKVRDDQLGRLLLKKKILFFKENYIVLGG